MVPFHVFLFSVLGYSVLRYAFCALNIVFSVFGLCSLVIGAWLYGTKSDYIYLLSHDFGALSSSALCVLIGIAVVTIAIIGCCGLWFENRCIILTHTLFTSLIFVVEVVVSVMMLLYKKEVSFRVEQELYNHFHANNVSDFNYKALFAVDMTWDNLQRELKCCGLKHYSDWYADRRRWPKNDWVPDSCCDLQKYNLTIPGSFDNCGKLMKPSLWHQQGCYKAFSEWLFNHFFVVGTINAIMAVVQVLAIINGIMIYWDMRKRQNEAQSLPNKYNPCSQQDSEA